MNRRTLVCAVALTTAALGLAVAAATAAPAAAAGPAASPGLQSAVADVSRVAPRLEQYYFTHGYPRDLAGAKASMSNAGQKLSPGNQLGGYRYDDRAREFVLCVQTPSGAFATYDTAPMATGVQGESGGCPKL